MRSRRSMSISSRFPSRSTLSIPSGPAARILSRRGTPTTGSRSGRSSGRPGRWRPSRGVSFPRPTSREPAGGRSATGRPPSRRPIWLSRGRSCTSRRRTTRWSPGARWPTGQNGRCFLHCSTQSVARTQRAHAQRLGIEEADLALLSPWTGGGFGSKIFGTITDVIPAALSREIGRPVMMRVTRDEETYFGRARSGLQGWVKMGFRADGRPHRGGPSPRAGQRVVRAHG